jgi:hypothetical protein
MGITVTRLIGGLGNQLFQYAMGRAVSIRNRTELVLDVEGFNDYKVRAYSLHFFALAQRFPNAEEEGMIRTRGQEAPPRKRGWLGLFSKRVRHLRVIQEELFSGCHPELLSAPPDTYLDGYWQCPEYFQHIEEILRSDFRIIKPLSSQNQEILKKIHGSEAVSVHVRRGDYVTDSSANQLHGTCEPAYYNRAFSHMLNYCAEPRFFIFSDEPDWVRNNLKLPERHYIVQSPPGTLDFEDLWLMSSCRHHIMANSTYSWWGAWLNSNKSKRVIGPKQWYRSRPEPVGLFLPDWIGL